MKTFTPHLLAAVILPAAWLSSRCATTGGTPPRSDTVATTSSQPLVKKSCRPPSADPRDVAADSRTDGQRGGRIDTGGVRVIELEPIRVNGFSALPDWLNHGPVYIGDDPRWINEMGRSYQQRLRPSEPEPIPLAVPHGDGYY